MAGRAHRFIQYLGEGDSPSWAEMSALDGHSVDGHSRILPWVRCERPGRFVHGVKRGIRLVIKQFARAIYISPALVLIKLIFDHVPGVEGDWITVGFVLFVCAFFALLNLYVVWSVVEHFSSRGKWNVVAPFRSDTPEDFGRGVVGDEVVRRQGFVARLDDPLPGSTQVIRDLWTFEGEATWRMTEAVDLAVVTEGERPLILRFNTAPMLLASPETETVGSALQRMSPGLGAVFDISSAIAGDRSQTPASFLTLGEGDEVEVIGLRHGEIPNVNHFDLAGRARSLQSSTKGFAPYRGVSGEPGTLLIADAKAPIWLRKV